MEGIEQRRWPYNRDDEDDFHEIEPYDEYEDVRPNRDDWDNL